MYNFKIVNGDTDSILICKQDMSVFPLEEQEKLIIEINEELPEFINFKNDGIFPKVLCLKTKNYVMINSKGIKKIKGSALKSATLEPALKVFLNEMIDILLYTDYLDERNKLLLDIYNKYVNIIKDIKDIKPWAKKQTLSKVTFDGERKNETDVINAIKGKEYGPGDKVYLISKASQVETGEIYKVGKNKGQPKMKKVKTLILLEDFNGEYDPDIYYEKLYKCVDRFKTVIPVKELFKKVKSNDTTIS